MAASFVARQSSLLWTTYVGALERRPLITKIATGILGTVLGDGIAQHAARHMREAAEHDKRRRGGNKPTAAATTAKGAAETTATPLLPPPQQWRYDFARTARLCAYSALLGTPIAHYWFAFLDKGSLLPAAALTSKGLAAACKTALDQLVMAPIGLSLFFVSLSLMEGKTLGDAFQSASSRIKPALAANYALWPGAQAVNFALVPPKQRVLYVNAVAIAWTAVLSHLASAETAGAGAPAPLSSESESGGGGRGPPDTFVPVVP